MKEIIKNNIDRYIANELPVILLGVRADGLIEYIETCDNYWHASHEIDKIKERKDMGYSKIIGIFGFEKEVKSKIEGEGR